MTSAALPSAASQTLGLFAKKPVPGQVKTRLAARSSPAWAARVAAALLEDAIERLASIPARRVLVHAPEDAGPYFAGLVQDRFELLPQQPGDLGQRMAAFFRQQLAAGAGAVVLVGSDSPTLPLAYVQQAFSELEHAGVVLGPATDGGYYLVGCAGTLPPIFEGISWGGSQVLSETISRLTAASLQPALLPPWYDVDTLDDLWMLRGHVAALRAAGIDPGAPHVEHVMQQWQEKEMAE